MYDEQLRTNKEEDQQFQGRTDLGCELRQVTKVDQCIILRQQNDIAVIDIFNKKKKCYNRLCPDSVYMYFHTLLLI